MRYDINKMLSELSEQADKSQASLCDILYPSLSFKVLLEDHCRWDL